MELLQANFSVKFEPQIRIRRYVNEIEDFLSDYYGPPQIFPIPDDFASDAPRIIMESKNGHSKISFSQISLDFSVTFDNAYIRDFSLTESYIQERVRVLKELLSKIGINQYYFAGLSYSTVIDTGECSANEYMINLINDESKNREIYEVHRRLVFTEEDTYFVNEEVGNYRKYQSLRGEDPNLVVFNSSNLVYDGVGLFLDVNNRFNYLKTGSPLTVGSLNELTDQLFTITKKYLERWD